MNKFIRVVQVMGPTYLEKVVNTRYIVKIEPYGGSSKIYLLPQEGIEKFLVVNEPFDTLAGRLGAK